MEIRRRVFFLLWLMFLSMGTLQAKDDPEALLQALPENIADCRQGKPQSYGNPKLGNSIDYDRDGLHITVYAYDQGYETIGDGIEDPLVKSAFEGAKGDVQIAKERGIYLKVRLIDDGKASHGHGLTTLRATFHVTAAKGEPPASEFYSEIHVYGARNQIIKLRISTNRVNDPEISKTILRFVPELMEALARVPNQRKL
jgi:hypothetical protein